MTTISVSITSKPSSHGWNTWKQNSAFYWCIRWFFLNVQIQRIIPAYIKIFRSCNSAMIVISQVRIQRKESIKIFGEILGQTQEKSRKLALNSLSHNFRIPVSHSKLSSSRILSTINCKSLSLCIYKNIQKKYI